MRGSLDGLREENGNGHGADAAGDGSDQACPVPGGLEVDVTDVAGL